MLLFALILSGCAKKTVISVPPPEAVPPEKKAEAALFKRADTLLQSGFYAESLEAFSSYLKRYPEGMHADGALMKIAAIQKTLGDLDAAHRAYQELVQRFPRSRFIPEAQVGILEVDYEKAAYMQVIQGAKVLLDKGLSRPLQVRLFTVLGDTYQALERYPEALDAYLRAVHAADGARRERLLSRMEEAIAQLDTETLRLFMKRTTDPILKSRLLLQWAINAADSQKPETAAQALNRFLSRYPGHPLAGKARALLETLTSEAAFDPHTVGCLLPLSGAYRAYGKKALRGIELALTDFTATPGHPRIKLVVRDTRSDPEGAAAGIRELARARVAAVIGPLARAEAAAAEAQKLKIPIITLTQKEKITRIGDYVFRNFMTPRMQVEALVDFCVKRLGLSRFAVLYPDESYGKTFMNLFWDAVIAHGGTMMGVEAYAVHQTDFADPIKKLTGMYYKIPKALQRAAAFNAKEEGEAFWTGPETSGAPGSAQRAAGTDPGKGKGPFIDFEALFIPDAPRTAGLILPQLAFHDVRNVYLMGTNLWHSHKLIQMAKKYAQGAMMVDGFDVNSRAEPVKAFVEKFVSVYGETPGFMEAVAYDTARIVFETAAKPRVRFRSRFRDALLTLSGFQGLTGPTFFGPDGEAQKRLILFRIQGDAFVEIR